MEEIWKDIIGYEGAYQISNLGKVKNIERKVLAGFGSMRTIKERILKPIKQPIGYSLFRLAYKGTSIQHSLHRLLAQHFIENPDNLPQVLHFDDDKSNNSLSNLRWGTAKDNKQDSIRNNTYARGHGKKGTLNHNFGKTGEKNWNSKIIINEETGIFYYSCKEAAASVDGLDYRNLMNKLGGNQKNNTPFKYV